MTSWLLGTLIATSALILLVLLIREPMRRRFGSRVAYGLWLIPAARLLMPTLTQTIERTVPAGAPVQPLLQPVAGEQMLLSSVSTAHPSLLEELGGWTTILMTLWLGIALGLFASRMIAFRRDRRAILANAVEIARLGTIRLVRSSEVCSPIAFGIFDRVIAVPVDFDRLYDERERRLALDHELAHHRSGDLIANLFAFVLLCLQWFNPLAWVAHVAFRFDQEAACDARVLDKAKADDRAGYGRAIAKAASGRALLFAGVLDRPDTLQKRLRSMLTSPSTGRQVTGKSLIVLTAAAALPFTASWATHYVDVPDVAPLASAMGQQPAATPMPPASAALSPAATMAAAQASPAAPVSSVRENGDGTVTLAGGVKLGKGSTAFFANDDVLINGKAKRLEQLTPAERSQLRATILRSQRELVRERAELPQELAELRRDADRARSGALKRELLRDLEDLRRDLAEVEAEADELRANGEDPEKLKAEIRESLREVEAIDIDKEVRDALAEADPNKVIAELRAEEEQMARMLARLEQLGRR
jgi:bla regulator protein BlaR1